MVKGLLLVLVYMGQIGQTNKYFLFMLQVVKTHHKLF